ncbi:MAG: translation initiation factor [Arcobacteraceae bacterium]|jgi:translation initiation factor 1|nr:translation initiation factor [Arcobacteraceae bacterium]
MFELGAKLEQEKYEVKKAVNKVVSSVLIPKNQHQLVFTFEKRNGKPVTLVGKFQIDEKEKKEVLSLLKKKLACGGTVADEWIEIQGDKKEKIIEILEKDGWKFRKK